MVNPWLRQASCLAQVRQDGHCNALLVLLGLSRCLTGLALDAESWKPAGVNHLVPIRDF
jgi:hypothetical protein